MRKDLEYVDKTENHGKRETHTVGPGIGLETLKTWEMRNAHCRTWNMVRNIQNMENRNAHCKTKNKARSEKNVKNETNTLWPGLWRETIKP